MAAALVVSLASRAPADLTTEQSASILVFPKVIADGTRDTVIQITNTSNSMVHAHCFYVNGALTFPELDEGPNNPPLWTEIDFDIWLTKQQPTYWVVSEGRLVDPSEEPCSRVEGVFNCENAGIDPGRVPPVVEDFTGELKCVETDSSGAPVSGNHLKGEATLITLSTDEVAKYNAIGVIGNENNNGDGVLCLGGETSDLCEIGAEYNACPQTWILNHLSEDASDPFFGDGDPETEDTDVDTTVTVVPCTQNFETQVPTSVTIQFAITNEYEQTFSASTTVTCWKDLELDDLNEVFEFDSVGTTFLQTRMRPSSGTAAGFMVVAAEEWATTNSSPSGEGCEGSDDTCTAFNVHHEGERQGPDIIVIPSEQLPPTPEP
jgi:hypothetical protein